MRLVTKMGRQLAVSLALLLSQGPGLASVRVSGGAIVEVFVATGDASCTCSARRPNKRMQLTKLRAAPVLQAEVPPCAPAGRMDGGTASQLIRSVRRTCRVEGGCGSQEGEDNLRLSLQRLSTEELVTILTGTMPRSGSLTCLTPRDPS